MGNIILMRYTYIIDVTNIEEVWNNFEKRARYEVKRCKDTVWQSNDLKRFNELHKITRPARVIDEDYIKKVWQEWSCMIFCTTTAMTMIGFRGDTGYYLLGARDKRLPPDGSSSLILWEVMKFLNSRGYKKFNLCGANKPNIKLFKKSFGGKLVEQIEPCLKY